MGKAGQGLAGVLGKSRREDPIGYQKLWREQNREKLNKYHRNYYHEVTKRNPEKLAKMHASGAKSRRKSKYGVTQAQYDEMLTAQEGRCIICRDYKGDELRVDYDHSTGEIRGLLCSNCNSGLGLFKEDPNRLFAAIDYVKQHSTGS